MLCSLKGEGESAQNYWLNILEFHDKLTCILILLCKTDDGMAYVNIINLDVLELLLVKG